MGRFDVNITILLYYTKIARFFLLNVLNAWIYIQKMLSSWFLTVQIVCIFIQIPFQLNLGQQNEMFYIFDFIDKRIFAILQVDGLRY